MSSTNILTGNIYDLSRSPQADTVTITPLIPTDVTGVVGVGITDDGVITGDPVTVAASAAGEFTAAIIPTSQTRAGPSGIGVRYEITFGPGESVTIEMPDSPARVLSDIIGGTVAAAAVDSTQVVYSRSKNILVGGTNVTLDADDTDQTITINSAGGSGGGGGDVTTAQLTAVSDRVTTNADNISSLGTRVANDEGALQTERTQRTQGDDILSVTVSTAASFNSTLDSQATSRMALVLVVDTAISGTRSGTAFNYAAGDVLYFPPISASAEFLFNIDSGTGIPAYPSGESGIKGLRIRSDGLVLWGDNNDVPIACLLYTSDAADE